MPVPDITRASLRQKALEGKTHEVGYKGNAKEPSTLGSHTTFFLQPVSRSRRNMHYALTAQETQAMTARVGERVVLGGNLDLQSHKAWQQD